MADITVAAAEALVAALEKVGLTSKAAQNNADKLLNSIKNLSAYGSDKIKGLVESLEKVSKSATDGKLNVGQLEEVLGKLATEGAKALDSLTGGFGVLSAVAADTGKIFTNLMKGFEGDSQGFNQNLAEMAVKTGALTAAFTDLAKAPNAFKSLQGDAQAASQAYLDLAKAIPGVGNALAAAFEKGEYAKAFENNLAKMAAQSGSLYGLWGANRLYGPDFDRTVEEKMNSVVVSTVGAANTMGMTLQEAMNRNMQVIGKLPDEMGRFYEVNNEKGMGAMQLLSTVATGTGQDFTKTIETAQKMYANFQSTAKEAAETFSLMSKVSNELQINFDKMHGTVMSINEGFKMWGDTSKDTIGMMREITQVLKEQGLGYEAGQQVLQQLVGSIQQMGIEKKAFIAMGAGMGGTPLQAGLNVERMIQKGEIGEIANMLQETLGNIGGTGRVLNLEEAASTPGMEANFLAQRQALGMFGVSDTGTANRLMDVMSKVQVGTEIGAEGQKALEEAFGQGANVQERQFNELIKIANNIDASVNILASFEAYGAQRKITGSAGPLGTDRATRLREQQEDTLATPGGAGRTVAELATKNLLAAGGSVTNVLNNFGVGMENGSNKIKEVLGSLGFEIDKTTKSIKTSNDLIQQRVVSETKNMNVVNSQNAEAAGGVIPMPPGTVAGPAGARGPAGRIVNVPMPAGAGGEEGGIFDFLTNAITRNTGGNLEGTPNQNANTTGTDHTINIFTDGERIAKVAINTVKGFLGITETSGGEGRH